MESPSRENNESFQRIITDNVLFLEDHLSYDSFNTYDSTKNEKVEIDGKLRALRDAKLFVDLNTGKFLELGPDAPPGRSVGAIHLKIPDDGTFRIVRKDPAYLFPASTHMNQDMADEIVSESIGEWNKHRSGSAL